MLHETENLERFSGRQCLPVPGVQGESLATRLVNQCRRFHEAKQHSNVRMLVNFVGVSAGLEADGPWRMTLSTPPGRSAVATRRSSTGHATYSRRPRVK